MNEVADKLNVVVCDVLGNEYNQCFSKIDYIREFMEKMSYREIVYVILNLDQRGWIDIEKLLCQNFSIDVLIDSIK